MSLFNVFNIASSSMAAQSQRLNVVASNLANADSATSSTGEPYRSRQVVFSTQQIADKGASGVKVAGIVHDASPMKRIYEPKHPMADAGGYITMPNVNVVDEMVNMMSASRSYQNSVDMMNTTKTLLQKALTIGQ
ncbi:MAG: flagellar basal-body rod protein FlgC [Nitrosomonas sp.]|jgi:flagellar basal-body rod protein FlgC|nr:MAG: flagellar basal-body rod protein FlgC [Nitrosomonas sp.]